MATVASFPSFLRDNRTVLDTRLHARRICFSSACSLTDAELLTTKTRLRELGARTRRGLLATSTLRGEIEETQVTLEKNSPTRLDFEALKGRWRMIYTNTRDVLPVLFLGNPPVLSELPLPWPVSVGAIYQEFSSPEEGSVQNIIKLGLDNVFEDEGITLTVQAKYEVVGDKRIALEFQDAGVGNLEIAPLTESILAPAFLPRTGFNHRLLLAIKEFTFSVPLQQRGVIGSDSTAGYLLTYLDEDMLIGRPLDTGGTFIFNKERTETETDV